jgi:hypothetical protein
MKCLAKKAEDGWASAEDLALALEPFNGRPQTVPVAADADAIAAMKPRPGRMVLVAVGLIALVAGGGYWALKPYDEAILAPPPPPPPVVEAPKPPEQIVFDIQSSPTGARVTRVDTGAQLGIAPLEVKLEKRDGATVTLRFELEGRQTLERSLSLSRNSSLSVDLPAGEKVVEKAEQPRPKSAPLKKRSAAATSRDGVVDPFDK